MLGNRRDARLAAAYALGLFALNVYIVRELFTIEFTRYLFNVEGSFISISRFLLDHPSERSWWPLWNLGMPFHCTYLPVLPMLVAVWAKVTGCSPALSYHAVTAFFYCLGPVTLFMMAFGLSRRVHASFFAALAYAVVSPSALLIPAVRDDISGLWNARRLHALVYYGEGPNTAALALLPLAVLFLHLSLRDRRRVYYLLAGVLMSAVVLTNAFGAVTLGFAVLCLLFSRNGRSAWGNLLLTLGISATAYLWISPWLPPSFLKVIQFNSRTSGGDFRWTAYSFAATLAAAGLFALTLAAARRWRLPGHLRFFLLLSAVLTAVTLLGAGPGWNAIPQSLRYHLAMETALYPALVFVASSFMQRLPNITPLGIDKTKKTCYVWA